MRNERQLQAEGNWGNYKNLKTDPSGLKTLRISKLKGKETRQTKRFCLHELQKSLGQVRSRSKRLSWILTEEIGIRESQKLSLRLIKEITLGTEYSNVSNLQSELQVPNEFQTPGLKD